MDYSLLTLAELDAEHLRLSTEIGRLSDERLLLMREKERRAATARTRAQLDSLCAHDRAALLKELSNAE